MWLPKRARHDPPKPWSSLGIVGPAGVGKSGLVRQLAEDPEFTGKVIVFMAENSVSSYGEENVASGKVHIVTCGTAKNVKTGAWVSPIDEITLELEAIGKAREAGEEMPLVGVVDSMSGLADYIGDYHDANPVMTKEKDNKAPSRNKLAEYDVLGTGLIKVMRLARDVAGIDMILLATSTPPPHPELCIRGSITPKNFNRVCNVCLFMTSTANRYDPETIPKPRPHRSWGKDQDGLVVVVNRYFTTQNTGEVPAKGHHSLELVEPAILPRVLRKIHGRNEESLVD